jgi:hypothetical protein
MLKTMRETFDAAGGYGITFTIPSSYWYLRWFDLPGLLQYADWVSLMSKCLPLRNVGTSASSDTRLTLRSSGYDIHVSLALRLLAHQGTGKLTEIL